MDTLAHRLKTEREARHLTQSALAKLVSPKRRQSINATVLEHHAVIVRGNKVAPATWNSACAGKQARDLSAVVRLYE